MPVDLSLDLDPELEVDLNDETDLIDLCWAVTVAMENVAPSCVANRQVVLRVSCFFAVDSNFSDSTKLFMVTRSIHSIRKMMTRKNQKSRVLIFQNC